MARPAGVDKSTLPKDYLEAYPYPAFVLIAPIPPPAQRDKDSDEFPAPERDHHLPFTRVNTSTPFQTEYANAKWSSLTQGRQLLQCLSIQGARDFGDWISGARAARARDGGPKAAQAYQLSGTAKLSFGDDSSARTTFPSVSLPSGSSTVTYTSREAPEGFWEPDVAYEDRSSSSDHASSDTGNTGVHLVGEGSPGPQTLLIELIGPGRITLELTKTTMPMWRDGQGAKRTRIDSHTYVIVTTIPRSSFVANEASSISEERSHPPIEKIHIEDIPPDSGRAVSSSPQRPYATIPGSPSRPPQRNVGPSWPFEAALDPSTLHTRQVTPTDEIMALDLLAQSTHNRPLLFNRDGTISRQDGPSRNGRDRNGRSLNVHELLKETDWSKTALGPKESWPQSLRTIVSLVMHYPHQCCLWWGEELTLIYNTPYSETIHKHPEIFGMSGPLAWAEIWSQLGPMSELVLSGTPVYKEDDFLMFKQLPHQGNGTFEAYHSWMWVPVLQENGSFGGLWNATIETTKKVLAERRLGTVREMGERTSIARTMREFDLAVVDILGSNPRDVPFAILYHVELSSADKKSRSTQTETATQPFKSDNTSTSTTRVTLHHAGSVGVPDNHPAAPAILNIDLVTRPRNPRLSHSGYPHNMTNSPTMSVMSSLSNLPAPLSPVSSNSNKMLVDQWPLKEALQSRRLVLVDNCSALMDNFSVRVWDELPTAAVVVPIANDSDEGIPSSVIIIGLSVRRPYDNDYESFVHVMKLQLASGIAAVRSYEAEQQRLEELAALDRAKSLLFSNVSHELRTPLTLVSGPLEDMLNEEPEGPKKERLVMARRNMRRLNRLVSTLMDVSRLEAGRLKGSFKLVNLGMVTRDLAALFRGAIERAKLRYIVECDLSARNVYVDMEHWEKVIFNLIGNAMKYTMNGYVHVSLSYRDNQALLAVKDSGVGIPKSDISLIGERFHRVESVSRSHEGTGIGLALIKELIKLHGGTMEIQSVTAAESTEGAHGSTFLVGIPLGTDHLPPDAIEAGSAIAPRQSAYGQGIVDEAMLWNRDREGSSADSSSDSGVGSGDSKTGSSRAIDPSTLYFKKNDIIMLVDDSFDTRRYMKSIFAPYCTIVEARDGLEALELCAESVPDLIVSDVMMPNLDGYGLLARLKDPAPSNKMRMIPVILLTARGGDESKVEGLLAGADDYIGKPFNARELIARAHMQLQLGKRRKALEEAFEERTAELRTLSEYSPVGIFRCAEDGSVTYVNGEWYEMSGHPVGEPLIDWGDYIVDRDRSSVEQTWAKVFTDDLPTQITEWQFTNGRWVTAKIIRLDKAASGLKGILGCLTDITERKLHEETQRLRVVEAEERRLEAEEAKRQQELLIDITSHEIRNPISSLMQCSSLVKTNLLSLLEQLESVLEINSTFSPTQQLITTINEDLEALESIYQCGLAQERISNDVLSLGRIQLDMLQMFDVEVELRSEAQKVLSIFQNEARMKRIGLSLKIGESVGKLGVHHIKTDPVRLGQVMTNLLSNAIRFTSNSSVRHIELRYDVSLDPPANASCLPRPMSNDPAIMKEDMPIYLYIAVTDTGPGLTPNELDMLFQRFSQVSPKTHTIFGGSGLGLFVCRKITELMGGRIEVASEYGKGSTFRFFIQTRLAQTQKRSHSATSIDSRPQQRRKNTSKIGLVGPKPHVLIVEDNLINQTVLMRQLRHVGLTCEVASNGLEALGKIREVSSIQTAAKGQPFDCVLMDLEMPVMDGLTAVKHIRDEEAAGTLSLNLVIALTGNARQGQIDDAKASGMDEVVIKPYRLDDLLQKIEEMMKVRAAQASANKDPSSPQAIEVDGMDL